MPAELSPIHSLEHKNKMMTVEFLLEYYYVVDISRSLIIY